MAFTVVIPARLDSSRLQRKMLADLGGKTLIERTVEQATRSEADRVLVATDAREIASVLDQSACEVVMTRADHLSGTDRLAEVALSEGFDEDHIVVNVQGDEPMIPPRLINEVAACLHHAADSRTVMATAAVAIEDVARIDDPNAVKVVVGRDSRALYFSRAAIPYPRNPRPSPVLHHIGIYAYRAHFLPKFSALSHGILERAESLEQLRVLEHGYDIAVHRVDYPVGQGIDTQEDLLRAREQFVGAA